MTTELETELQRFKAEIDLVGFSRRYGFREDERESTKNGRIVRREADNAKLSMLEGTNGLWMWYDFRSGCSGSIIDLVQREEHLSLGHVRALLRKEIGSANHNVLPQTSPNERSQRDNEPDRRKAMAVWNAAAWSIRNDYLESRRGISPATLGDPRFRDCWRLTEHGATLFPHVDLCGLCGYEVRGEGLKAFGSRTVKGLWVTANVKQAPAILITESAIDAMSHYELHGEDYAYASVSGTVSARQRELLTLLFSRAVNRSQTVILGVDNDAGGDALEETLQLLSPEPLLRAVPAGKDWNDDLIKVLRENA